MRRTGTLTPGLLVATCLLGAFPAARAQDGPLGIGQSTTALTETLETEHFQIHYRPGSKAGSGADRVAWMAESEFARILDRLQIAEKVDQSTPFHLFLYDSVDEMLEVSETAGNAGFSAGRESHIPFDNDQTRLHEMVHIVLAAMEVSGDEARNMFFVEGIANAVLEFVHGVPVHAVAAYEKRRGSLPALSVLVGEEDFYQYLRRNPQFNGYDVGASFMLHLLDTYGARKVMTYYHGVSARKALGARLEIIEKQWHTRLEALEIRPELEILLAQRRGDGGEFSVYSAATAVAPRVASASPVGFEAIPLDEHILGDPGDWEDFSDQIDFDQSSGVWKREAQRIVGKCSSGSDWSICECPQLTVEGGILRATIQALGSCWGVQLRFGDQLQGMVLGQGAFLYLQEKQGMAYSEANKLIDNQKIEMVLRVHDGKADLWLDGNHVLQAEVPTKPTSIGLGLVGGSAAFSNLRLRRLPGE